MLNLCISDTASAFSRVYGRIGGEGLLNNVAVAKTSVCFDLKLCPERLPQLVERVAGLADANGQANGTGSFGFQAGYLRQFAGSVRLVRTEARRSIWFASL